MLNPKCPIHQDTVHCASCYFAPQGKCEHARIMRERHEQALKIENQGMVNANDSLLRKD